MLMICGIFVPISQARTQLREAERVTDAGFSPHMVAWSPLAPLADLPRALTRPSALPDLLTSPPPRVGLFWSVGNPAAVALEVPRHHTEFRAGSSRDAGVYRRPLDADHSSTAQLAGLAWQPVGRRSVAIGRVIIDRESLSESSRSEFINAHASNPLVPVDTSTPAMRRDRVIVEGSLGRRVGGFAFGLGAGLEARDHRTVSARLPRISRVTTPALVAGITRSLGRDRIRVGVHGRWLGGTETANIFPFNLNATVFQIEGYADPDTITVTQQPYYRRAERSSLAVGIGASVAFGGATWVAAAERTGRREGQFSERREDPRKDRWSSDGRVLKAAAQRPLWAGRILLTARGRHERLAGEATRGDLAGAIFITEESVFDSDFELRFTPSGGRWLAAGSVATRRERRLRRDFIADRYSNMDIWTPGGTVEVGLILPRRTAVSVGYALSRSSPIATIPNPALTGGPVFRQLTAPELAFHATPAIAGAAAVTLKHTRSSGAALWFRGSGERLGPGSFARPIPTGPAGTRTLWSASVGVTLPRAG